MTTRFSLQIADFAERFGDKADLVLRKVALDLSSQVIMGTPVDTGRARANWSAGVGELVTRIIEVNDKEGHKTVAEATNVIITARFGQAIHLSNSLPYIQRLEAGYSKKAPAGMVGLAVARFQTVFDNARREVMR